MLDESQPSRWENWRFKLSDAWTNFLYAVYQLSPFQRLVIIAGIVLLIPGYFVARTLSSKAFGFFYGRSQLVAMPSFTQPLSLKVGSVELLDLGNNEYTGVFTVSNSNTDLAVDKGEFLVRGVDESGAAVYQSNGEFFLLPGQKRTLILPKFTVPENLRRLEVGIPSLHWQKPFEIPTLEIVAILPKVLKEGNPLSMEGALINQSPHTLGKITVDYFFYDSKGKLVNAVSRDEFDVRPGSRRTFPFTVEVGAGLSVEDMVNARVQAFGFSNPLSAKNIIPLVK